MLKSILESGGKALYLTPLRALASEKYEEFQPYSQLGVNVGITTGDYDTADEKYGAYDLLICTNERADSLLRHRSKWLSEISIVVADEVHLINDSGRGPTLEVVLARLRQIAHKAQILALSATVNNAQELADWLQGRAVISDWRPVPLREGVYREGKVYFGDGSEERYTPTTAFPIGDIARRVLKQKGQLLAFLNTRRSAVRTAQKLSPIIAPRLNKTEQQKLQKLAETILHLGEVTQVTENLARLIRAGVSFHHAGLRYAERKHIEDAFRNNLIKVICATPTLCLAPYSKIWHGVDETEVAAFKNSTPLYALQHNELICIQPDDIVALENSKPLIEFTSVSGYRIQVSPNHRMLVRRNNKRLMLPAMEITKDDRIGTARRIKPRSIVKVKVSDFIVDRQIEGVDYAFDTDLAYFVGLMLGDGYSGAETNGNKIKYKGSPVITGHSSHILTHVDQVCTRLGISTRRGINVYDVPQLTLGKNNWFREFLVRCGIEKSDQKYIDQKLMKMNGELTASLLRGLFDTAGFVIKGKEIGFTHSSEKLIKHTQKLLLRFGIVSRIRKKKSRETQLHNKTYAIKPVFELIIGHNQCLQDFQQHIGFGMRRKRNELKKIVDKITSNILYLNCPKCEYRIYKSLFSGRTKKQKEWGKTKYEVIRLLGAQGELGSNKIRELLECEPKKNETRLNHHYQLISKRKIGKISKTEWFWSLNPIGEWIYKHIVAKNQNLQRFFKNTHCPLCNTKLSKTLRKTWRTKDLDNDIFWDIIREIKIVEPTSQVFDVVLPSTHNHNHLLVVDGFLVHNSAGLNLPARVVVIREYRRYDRVEGYQPIPVLEYKQMCLPKDQVITTESGLVPIKTIIDDFQNIDVLTFNQQTRNLEFQPITQCFSNGNRAIYRILLKNGIKLKATLNHRFLIIEGQDEFKWVPLKDLRKGDRVIYTSIKNNSTSSSPLPYEFLLPNLEKIYVINSGNLITDYAEKKKITERELAKQLKYSYKLSFHYKTNRKAMPLRLAINLMKSLEYDDKEIAKSLSLTKIKTAHGNPWTLPSELTPDLLYLAGFIYGDGNIKTVRDKRYNNKHYSIRLFNTNPLIISSLKEKLDNLEINYSEILDKRREPRFIGLSISNSAFAFFIKEFLRIPDYEKSKIISIPHYIQSLPLRLLNSFLAGYFDADGSYTSYTYRSEQRRVLFSTSSKQLALDLHNLLLRYRIFSDITSQYNTTKRKIRDGVIQQKTKNYHVIFRKNKYLKQFFSHIHPVKITSLDLKTKIDVDAILSNFITIPIKSIKFDSYGEVYNIEVEGNQNFLCNNVVVHNSGRAGRPKYDTSGTSILLSRNEGEREFLFDYYILGSPESIISKLANESALRSHVLSTIAMRYASDKEGIMDFIRQTFFGHQRDPDEVEYMIDLIVKFLKDEKLLEQHGTKLSATKFGRRTSQLYIDPKSAVVLRDGLTKAASQLEQTTDISFLHLISHTPDMISLYLRRGEDERFHDYVVEHIDEFLVPVPDPRHHRDRYEFFLAEVKTALLAKAWIEELPEDQLIDQFKIGSGDLLRLVDTQAWLLYACRELAPLFGYKDLVPDLDELELRIRYGVKRELAELVELQGIGRVRARFLFRAGFISKNRIRDAPISKLATIPTIGLQIAKSIKVQCGGVIDPAEEEQALKAKRRSTTRHTQLTLD